MYSTASHYQSRLHIQSENKTQRRRKKSNLQRVDHRSLWSIPGFQSQIRNAKGKLITLIPMTKLENNVASSITADSIYSSRFFLSTPVNVMWWWRLYASSESLDRSSSRVINYYYTLHRLHILPSLHLTIYLNILQIHWVNGGWANSILPYLSNFSIPFFFGAKKHNE